MKSKLDQIGEQARASMLPKNYYSDSEIYDQNHPNANQEIGRDDINNIKGKGTGIKFDFENGGSSYDIYGSPHISNTGRIAILQNKYTPDKKYTVTI